MRSGKFGIVFFRSSALTVFKLSFFAGVDAVEALGVAGFVTVVGATSAPALVRDVVAAGAGCEVVVLESLPPQAARNSAAGASRAAMPANRVCLKGHLNEEVRMYLPEWINRPVLTRGKLPTKVNWM
jgi:hypothetical protein